MGFKRCSGAVITNLMANPVHLIPLIHLEYYSCGWDVHAESFFYFCPKWETDVKTNAFHSGIKLLFWVLSCHATFCLHALVIFSFSMEFAYGHIHYLICIHWRLPLQYKGIRIASTQVWFGH